MSGLWFMDLIKKSELVCQHTKGINHFTACTGESNNITWCFIFLMENRFIKHILITRDIAETFQYLPSVIDFEYFFFHVFIQCQFQTLWRLHKYCTVSIFAIPAAFPVLGALYYPFAIFNAASLTALDWCLCSFAVNQTLELMPFIIHHHCVPFVVNFKVNLLLS